MPPTALSTYANCISAILELLKTLKKSRAESTRELFCRERNATTGTLFAGLYSDKCAWSVVGKLKPRRRFKVFFESTSTCSRQTAEPPLSANWNSTTTRLPCHFPPKYPAFANSAVLRCKATLSYLLSFFLVNVKKKPEYINLHRTCCQSNFYLFYTCLFFSCSLSRNNNCLCVKEQYFSNSQVLSNRRWHEKVEKAPVTFLAAKSSGYSRVLSSDCF